MVFKKLTQNSLMQDVVAQIEEAILTSDLRPGDKLPSPMDLEKMLGASRGTLREALRVLEQKGLIQIRLGAKGGAFVRESTTDPIAESMGLLIRQMKISLDDLAAFRKVVEPGLLNLVTKRITESDIEELESHLREMETQAIKGAAGWHGLLDVEVILRKALIRIAGNKMYEVVLVPIHNNIFSYGHAYLPGEKADVKGAYRDWREIIDALSKKDAETAIALTKNHIDRYARRMKMGQDKILAKKEAAPSIK